MPEYHSLRPAKALTNALERLMIAIDNADLEGNHALLLEYRKACELLGYDPAMAQWQGTKEVNIAKVKVKLTNVLGECVVNHGFEV